MLADRPDGRPLSAEERRQLDDLEHRLLAEPPAPPRRVPVGLAAARRARERPVLTAGLAVACALLVLAAVVGGPGGLAATAAALAATLAVMALPRLGRRLRCRTGPPRRRLADAP